jgi:hypothetical protein
MPEEILSPENKLAELIVQRIINNATLIKNCQRGTGPNSVKFDVLPAALVWYQTTNYPDDNAPKAGGGGTSMDHGSQALWVSEWPVFGAITFGNNQDEALRAMEELKLLVSGYMPDVQGRDSQFPLHPVHFAVPFELDGAQCVAIFFEFEWQYRSLITT